MTSSVFKLSLSTWTSSRDDIVHTEGLIWSLPHHRSHYVQQQAAWEAGSSQSNTNTTSSQESLSILLHWRMQREGLPSELVFGDSSDVYIPLCQWRVELGCVRKKTVQTFIVYYHKMLLHMRTAWQLCGSVWKPRESSEISDIELENTCVQPCSHYVWFHGCWGIQLKWMYLKNTY